MALTDALTPLLNTSLCLPSTHDTQPLVPDVPLLRFANSIASAERFRFITLTISDLEVIENLILKRLHSSLNTYDEPFHFASESKGFTLGTVTFPQRSNFEVVHSSVPRSTSIHKLEKFDCHQVLISMAC